MIKQGTKQVINGIMACLAILFFILKFKLPRNTNAVCCLPYYMKQNTKNYKPYTLNTHVSERLRDCNAQKAL